MKSNGDVYGKLAIGVIVVVALLTGCDSKKFYCYGNHVSEAGLIRDRECLIRAGMSELYRFVIHTGHDRSIYEKYIEVMMGSITEQLYIPKERIGSLGDLESLLYGLYPAAAGDGCMDSYFVTTDDGKVMKEPLKSIGTADAEIMTVLLDGDCKYNVWARYKRVLFVLSENCRGPYIYQYEVTVKEFLKQRVCTGGHRIRGCYLFRYVSRAANGRGTYELAERGEQCISAKVQEYDFVFVPPPEWYQYRHPIGVAGAVIVTGVFDLPAICGPECHPARLLWAGLFSSPDVVQCKFESGGEVECWDYWGARNPLWKKTLEEQSRSLIIVPPLVATKHASKVRK